MQDTGVCESTMQNRAMKLTIGPLLTPYEPPTGTLPAGIVALETSIEWASPSAAVQVPLFRHRRGQTIRFGIEDLVVRSDDLPCDITCAAAHVTEAGGVSYVPIEGLLYALYRTEAPRPICALLREMAEVVPLQSYYRNPGPAGGLIPAGERNGFCLATVRRSEHELLIELGWRASETAILHTVNGVLAFQGQDKGAWIESPIPGIAKLLSAEMHRLLPRLPGDLLSDRGRQYLASLHPTN